MTAPDLAWTPIGPTSRSRWPGLTATVFVITVVVSVVSLFSSGLMDLFTRDLTRVQHGEWWRLVTPVLVQSSGWGQLAFNMLGLAVVGAALESRLSRGTWALIYLVGGVGSIALGSAWHPHAGGGGSSDAVAALIGALAVLLFVSGQTSAGGWPAQLYSVFFATYLTGLALGGLGPAIIAGHGAVVVWSVARRAASPMALRRACLAVVVGGGVLMTVAEDGHGTGMLAGVAIGSLVLAGRCR
jgi:membrane associated rhomboid family serine protease